MVLENAVEPPATASHQLTPTILTAHHFYQYLDVFRLAPTPVFGGVYTQAKPLFQQVKWPHNTVGIKHGMLPSGVSYPPTSCQENHFPKKKKTLSTLRIYCSRLKNDVYYPINSNWLSILTFVFPNSRGHITTMNQYTSKDIHEMTNMVKNIKNKG